ncbi:MAG TPA: hypothetical protein VFV47_13640, partial [Hyphomicrobiaceae bacterium]|nr:hypothetical protein [Hyphomicrobiaceae bacterium]
RLSDRALELPEALHLETQKLTVRLDAARRLEGAARSLFACFSPRQKAKAGPLLARVCLDAVANTLPAAETNPPAFDPLLKVPQAVDIRAARAAPRARAAGRSGPVKLRLKRGDLRNG